MMLTDHIAGITLLDQQSLHSGLQDTFQGQAHDNWHRLQH